MNKRRRMTSVANVVINIILVLVAIGIVMLMFGYNAH